MQLSVSATSYTEDFDFEAMNEKFKKDEVWGHLGKSKENGDQNEDSLYGNDDAVEFPQVDIKVKCYSSLLDCICFMILSFHPLFFFPSDFFGRIKSLNSLFIRKMTFSIPYQATLLIMGHVEGADSLNSRGLIMRSVFLVFF